MPPEAIRSITRYRPSRVVSSERARGEAAVGPMLVVRDVVVDPFRGQGRSGGRASDAHCMGRGGPTRAGAAGWCPARDLPRCVQAHRGGRGRGGDGSPGARLLEAPGEGEAGAGVRWWGGRRGGGEGGGGL